MKSIDTLVKDIYKFLETGSVDLQKLASNIATVLAEKIAANRKPSLSMSQLGKPARRLWNDINYPPKVSGKDRLKFLYGDIIEAVILYLVEASGHSVKDCQRCVEVDGVKGAIDAIVDGSLIDVKSASPFTFEKFQKSSLGSNDSFGYLAQINGYNDALKLPRKAFLVVNKVSGEILLYNVDDDFESVDVHKLIKEQKESLKHNKPPAKPCYEPVPFGKSGNMVVARQCKWCPHLKRCWKNVTPVKYSNGVEYFTKIVKTPRNLKD